MTIEEVLAEVDETKPNQYDDALKVRWISQLEGQLVDSVFSNHINDKEIEFSGYTEADVYEELLVPDTYADIYKYYLFAMIDFSNQETDRYQNSMIMFNSKLDQFTKYYNRTHMPISANLKLF